MIIAFNSWTFTSHDISTYTETYSSAFHPSFSVLMLPRPRSHSTSLGWVAAKTINSDNISSLSSTSHSTIQAQNAPTRRLHRGAEHISCNQYLDHPAGPNDANYPPSRGLQSDPDPCICSQRRGQTRLATGCSLHVQTDSPVGD